MATSGALHRHSRCRGCDRVRTGGRKRDRWRTSPRAPLVSFRAACAVRPRCAVLFDRLAPACARVSTTIQRRSWLRTGDCSRSSDTSIACPNAGVALTTVPWAQSGPRVLSSTTTAHLNEWMNSSPVLQLLAAAATATQMLPSTALVKCRFAARLPTAHHRQNDVTGNAVAPRCVS